MFDLDSCIGFLTNVEAKKLSDAFNNRLLKRGITRVQWITMYYLNKYESLTQIELCEKLNVKPSSVVRLIDRMERDELIKRHKNPEDRRSYNITLSEKGNMFWREVESEGEDMSKLFMKDIDKDDLEVFKMVLLKMVDNSK